MTTCYCYWPWTYLWKQRSSAVMRLKWQPLMLFGSGRVCWSLPRTDCMEEAKCPIFCNGSSSFGKVTSLSGGLTNWRFWYGMSTMQEIPVHWGWYQRYYCIRCVRGAIVRMFFCIKAKTTTKKSTYQMPGWTDCTKIKEIGKKEKKKRQNKPFPFSLSFF